MTRMLLTGLWFVAACGFHPAGGNGGDDDGDAANQVTDAAESGDGAATDGAATDGAATDGPQTDAAVDAQVDAQVDAPPSTPVCPLGYAAINGSSTQYRIIETSATWAAAAADCNNDELVGPITGHTHLVVVGSAAEKTVLTNQFSGNTWVGLTDQATEGTFVWVTAENTNGFPMVGMQPPWDAGDPDGGTAENCVRFKNSFDFEDKPCTDANSYVCECDNFAPSPN